MDDAQERYQILGTLGTGGMGTVYRAHDAVAGRDVALKVVTTDTATAAERFRREGEITAKLVHPGIVRVHSGGQYGGHPYLAYELVEGAQTLRDVLDSAHRRRLLELLLETARALGFAHGLGVVHRDVKPENVLIDRHGRAKLSDFGVASARGLARLTQTGTMVGTPYYMAPEAFSGKASVGPPADVWALGVILYEALAGKRPFESSNTWELAAQIAKSKPAPLHESARNVSPALERVCLMALAADPQARYADAKAFADDLERAIAGEAVAAAGAGLRVPQAVWSTLALLPVAGVLALAFLYEPPPPTEPQPSAPRVKPHASKAASPTGPGFALAKGDTFAAHLGWIDDRIYTPVAGQTPGAPEKQTEVGATRFLLQQTVRDRRSDLLTLDGEIRRLRIAGKAQLSLDFDSDAGPSLVPLGHAVGETLIAHIKRDSGQPKRVFGLTPIRDDAVAKLGSVFKTPVKALLEGLDDVGLGRRLENLWHVLPDTGDAKLPEAWVLERPVWIRRTISVSTRVRFQPHGNRLEGSLVTWSPASLPPGTHVEAFTLGAFAQFRDGRLTRSLVEITTKVKTPDEAFEAYQAYYYGVAPCPADWDRRLSGGVALSDVVPLPEKPR